MQPFLTHTGVAAPLRRTNIDTDQIITAAHLKGITRTGYENALFSEWRKDENFVLNIPAYRNASILLVGSDFGTGSSREHAVWALMNYGFRVVVSPRFGDIFATNAEKQGLLTARCSQADVESRMAVTEADPGTLVTIDLVERTIRAREFCVLFQIEDYTRWRLMEGLDDITLALRNVEAIDRYEKTRARWLPTTVNI